MFGFITRLFGGSNNGQKPQQRKEAFFLEPMEAKTYGDYKKMEQPYKIRHTFPKTKNQEASEYEIEVTNSKLVKRDGAAQPAPKQPEKPKTETPVQSAPKPAPKPSSSSDLDFRNMARNMRK